MPKARHDGVGAGEGDRTPGKAEHPAPAGDDVLAAAWLWECGPDGRIGFLSPEFESSTGLSPQSLLGKRLLEIVPADAGSAGQRAAIGKRKPFYDLMLRIEREDGPGIWLQVAGAPVVGAEGASSGYRGIGKTVTAETDAALALRESEARFRQLFETASDWYWESDVKGRATFISPNFEARYGIKPERHIGKRLNDIGDVTIDPESGRKALAAIKAQQPYSDLVYSLAFPDGKTIWVTTSAVPMFDGDGRFRGYCGMSKDVTAQRDAERALRENEEQVRRLLEAASDFYWEYDAEYRYIYISPQIERHGGVPASEFLGKRLSDIPGVSVDPEMGRMVLSAFKAKQPYRDLVYSRKGPDGNTRWFKSSGAPNLDADGTFKGYRGVGAEITRHVEADQAARLAQSRLHEAVAHLTQPFVFYDAQHRATAYNQAFTDLHQAPSTNTPVCQGVSFRELAEWQLRVGFYAAGPSDEAITLDVLLERYQGESEQTYRLGDGRWMMVMYRRLPGGGRVGLWTDVTALKRAETERRNLEAQLQHSQRLEALGTLAGGAAHEINNALVPVIALTKIVASHLPEDSRDRRNLGTVLVGAERSRDLVKQILAFSRKENEERRGEGVDVAAVLREALRLMRATVPTSIRLDEEIASAPPMTCDPNQLHQVVVNLVNNAAQAIGEGHGTITVGLRAEPERAALRLWVADTGCGMDEATKARIFEPFFTTKEVGSGTGLGLAVVHGIIKDHGGTIEVESAPGRGTRFDVILPLPPAAAGKAA
jgi:PAS domain S-box-containing protein